LLALELVEGLLEGAHGVLKATGRRNRNVALSAAA
jgi:hypothetical protein